MKFNFPRFLLIVLTAIVLALVLPQIVFALGLTQAEPLPPYEIPQVFSIALVGFLTYLITHGIQNRFPQIANALAVLISALVATALDFLTGLINISVPYTFWPIATQVFILLATWLSAWGTKQVEKRVLKALAPPKIEFTESLLKFAVLPDPGISFSIC